MDVLRKHCNMLSVQQQHQCPSYCAGTNNTGNASYVCGDPRLGPVQLPTSLPLSNTVYGYDRFGGLCPGAFLATWYNSTGNSYIYPPLDGFQPVKTGGALNGTITLPAGMYIDRFGAETGRFLAPYGAPFDQRAVPPNNLDTYDGVYPYNYHVYNVRVPFDVVAGVIAGWFEQPGMGVQYYSEKSVSELIASGTVRRVNLDELTS